MITDFYGYGTKAKSNTIATIEQGLNKAIVITYKNKKYSYFCNQCILNDFTFYGKNTATAAMEDNVKAIKAIGLWLTKN